jgi:DNA invertase Pin-like site-specific DNA recombinase
MATFEPPLNPRNGKTLQVLTVSRISTDHQDVRCNDDQQAYCRRHLNDGYNDPVEWHVISGQGSGEYLDRKELRQAEELVESGVLDLVIVEDLARICRRSRAFDFCELCEDHDVRLIAINDHIDTGKENWRLNASFATIRHEMYNQDTSKRIKRSQQNRFVQGGVFQFEIYGYIKPPGAKNDADVRKDPDAEVIYDTWFRMLEEGAKYSEVADWLNARKVPLGKYCDGKEWTGRMVARVTKNPILKGVRERNRKESKRLNKTGRRRSVDAPPEKLLTRDCPHLAFIDPERYDRVLRMLKGRNAAYARGRRRGTADTRKGVSKKRTVWPGQHVVCGVCGRLYYWGGHGQAGHMMCSGARDYRCWNGATFDGHAAAKALGEAVLAEVEALPAFDETFLDRVRAHVEAQRGGRKAALETLDHDLVAAQERIDRVTEAIAQVGASQALRDKLTQLEADRDGLLAERDRLERQPQAPCPVASLLEIKRLAREAIGELAADRPEFGRRMRQLIPSLKVYPYQLRDGGAVVLRARLVLNLASLLPAGLDGLGADGVLRRELTVDLFQPPEREAFRGRVVALRATGLRARGRGAARHHRHQRPARRRAAAPPGPWGAHGRVRPRHGAARRRRPAAAAPPSPLPLRAAGRLPRRVPDGRGSGRHAGRPPSPGAVGWRPGPSTTPFFGRASAAEPQRRPAAFWSPPTHEEPHDTSQTERPDCARGAGRAIAAIGRATPDGSPPSARPGRRRGRPAPAARAGRRASAMPRRGRRPRAPCRQGYGSPTGAPAGPGRQRLVNGDPCICIGRTAYPPEHRIRLPPLHLAPPVRAKARRQGHGATANRRAAAGGPYGWVHHLAIGGKALRDASLIFRLTNESSPGPGVAPAVVTPDTREPRCRVSVSVSGMTACHAIQDAGRTAIPLRAIGGPSENSVLSRDFHFRLVESLHFRRWRCRGLDGTGSERGRAFSLDIEALVVGGATAGPVQGWLRPRTRRGSTEPGQAPRLGGAARRRQRPRSGGAGAPAGRGHACVHKSQALRHFLGLFGGRVRPPRAGPFYRSRSPQAQHQGGCCMTNLRIPRFAYRSARPVVPILPD